VEAPSLITQLDHVLTEVHDLAVRDQEGQAYVLVQERMAFLHDHLQRLDAALAAFCDEAVATPEGVALWEQTQRELRQRAPVGFEAPGKALLAGGVDLLKLVEYTGAALALVQERHARVRGE
jgi:hypothetical protein